MYYIITTRPTSKKCYIYFKKLIFSSRLLVLGGWHRQNKFSISKILMLKDRKLESKLHGRNFSWNHSISLFSISGWPKVISEIPHNLEAPGQYDPKVWGRAHHDVGPPFSPVGRIFRHSGRFSKGNFEATPDMVKFVMCTLVSRYCVPFSKYIKRHAYPGNQGTHDKLN